jgi:HPt (histidine-containing phosphotransfer) domain-containing protein
MAEMIGLYLQEIPQLVQTMKQAIAEKDWIALKYATHSIIPTFATMGMNPEFEDIAKSIQSKAVSLISVGDRASQEDMTGLIALFSKIESVSTLAAQELEEKLQSLSPTPSLA